MSEFISAGAPVSSDRLDWNTAKGSLMVVEPTSIEVGVQTVHGPSDAVKADVHVITGPGTSDDFEGVLIFPKVLQAQLRGQIGQKVVGRLNQGKAEAGKSAPWVLDAATADDLAKAQEWANAQTSTVTTAQAVAPF